jgi:Lysine methyltransferase
VTDLRLAMAKEIEMGDGTIYITDQANMIDIMTANIELNSLISRIIACELDWYLCTGIRLIVGPPRFLNILPLQILCWQRIASTLNLHFHCFVKHYYDLLRKRM